MVDCCTLGNSLGGSILVETSTGAIDVAVGTGRGSVVVVVLELVVVVGS